MSPDGDFVGAREVGRQVLLFLSGSGGEHFDGVGSVRVAVPGLTFGSLYFLASACHGTRVDMRATIINGISQVVVSVYGVHNLPDRRQIRRQLTRRLMQCVRTSGTVN